MHGYIMYKISTKDVRLMMGMVNTIVMIYEKVVKSSHYTKKFFYFSFYCIYVRWSMLTKPYCGDHFTIM